MGNQISNDANSPLHKVLEDTAYVKNDETVRKFACQYGIVWQQRAPFLVVPSNANDLNNLEINQKMLTIGKTLRVADKTGFTAQGTDPHARKVTEGEGLFSINSVGNNLAKCNFYGHNFDEGRCTSQDILSLESGYNTTVASRKAIETAELNRQSAENTAKTTIETNELATELLQTQIKIAEKSVEETEAEVKAKFEDNKEEIAKKDLEKIEETEKNVNIGGLNIDSSTSDESTLDSSLQLPKKEESFIEKNLYWIIGGAGFVIILLILIVLISGNRTNPTPPMMMMPQQPMMMPQQPMMMPQQQMMMPQQQMMN